MYDEDEDDWPGGYLIPCSNCESRPATITVSRGIESDKFCSTECQDEYNGEE